MCHRSILFIILSFALISCSTTGQSSRQLERVAKDWCLSVRASQIIPVYPLTEDIQPGDVFLVEAPIQKQIEIYKSKGFLPLENLVVRMKPTNYYSFYSAGYGVNETSFPPRLWQFPKNSSTSDYSGAPRSFFPSYSFSVSRSEGLNVALPVHSVPIGLNLLDSAEAHGIITITDSYTYGTDMLELWTSVNKWAGENKTFIKQFSPYEEESEGGMKQKIHYLRVINRVYLAGKVKVSLFSSEGFGAGLSAGLKRPVDLLNLGSGPDAEKNFEKINDLINRAMGETDKKSNEEKIPEATDSPGPSIGGTLKIAMASDRSVSLDEKFDRPLAIGYIAFDLPILENGELGSPVSTESRLSEKSTFEKPTHYGPEENSSKIRAWLKEDKNNREKLNTFLKSEGFGSELIPNIISGSEYKDLRVKIIQHFEIE